MPATYAHYKLGKRVYNELSRDIQKDIQKNKQMYLLGLHGPDILFYYNILMNNEVRKKGINTHDRPAKEFFAPAIQKIVNLSDVDAATSYLYGFLCLFALDSACHGYIEHKMNQSGVSHAEIEVEFDRMLIIADGYNPLRHNITNHISSSVESSNIIAPIFGDVEADHITKSIQSMIRCNYLILATRESKRALFNMVLKLSGHYEELHGLMVNKDSNPLCRDSNIELLHLYKNAIYSATELIEDFKLYIQQGNCKLDERFNRTFNAV